MNILERLIDDGKKKKDELANQIARSAPVKAIAGTPQKAYVPKQGQNGFGVMRLGVAVKPKPVYNQNKNVRVAQKVATGTGLAIARAVTDFGQAGSGLVDLASKGTGTSRVSKGLDRFAKNLDQTAKDRDVNEAYRIMQVPANIAGYYGPGGVAKGATKVIPALNGARKVVQSAGKTITPLQTVAANLNNGNTAQRIASRGVRAITPLNGLNAAVNTATELGRQSGKGHDISPQNAAMTAAANVALPIALPMAGRAVVEGGKATRMAVRSVQDTGRKIASPDGLNLKPRPTIPDRVVENARVIADVRKGGRNPMDTADYHLQDYRYLEHKLGSNDPGVVDKFLQDRTNYSNTKIRRQGDRNEVIRNIKKVVPTNQSGYARIPGSKDFHPDLSPQQKTFINEYANMLEDMGQGNGVDILSDGRRVSNNFRTADNKGKAMTKDDWFTQARQDLESGNGAYGASDEYKGIVGLQKLTPAQKTAPQPVPPASAKAVSKREKVDSSKGSVAQAESNFPLRMMEDERTDPLRPTLEANATHDVLHNKDVLAETSANITKDEDAALALAKRGTSTEANATSLQLLEKYISEGNMEKADDLLQAVLPRFTRQGQQTQILAVYSKLTPTGAVKYANQQMNKAVAKSGRGERIDIETTQLHENLSTVNNQAATRLEADINSGKLSPRLKSDVPGTKTDKTPEQMLADRIKATSERKSNQPDPIKDMVNTLHQVAKEVLPKQGKALPRDPMQLISQAIKDKTKYGDVYDKAKAIVLDKYADNPQALEELDKYFTSGIERPYGKNQLNKGVQNGLKGTDIGKLVREHYTKVDETGADLKAKLIQQAGLSDNEATQLAGDIQKRFTELTGNKKQQILDSMFSKTRNKPEQKNAVQKILELSNLGAFNKDELRSAVALKLGAPTLSGDATRQIAKMADDIQRLPDGSPERQRAAAEMMQFIHKQIPSSMVDKVMSAWTAGLISGGKTITGAPVSNVVNAASRTTVSPIAAGLDFARTAGGTLAPRSNTMVSPMNYVRGFREGLPKAKQYLKTGIDERAPMGTDYPEINYDHTKVGNLVNGVFRLMGALDRPFYYGQKALSQAETNKLARLNKGKQFSQKTPEELVEQDARMSVLDFDTVLSKIGTAVKRATDNHDDVFSRGVGKVAAQLNAPFVRIPSAGLSRMIDFSPMGTPINVARQLANMKWGAQKGIDWRSLNTAIGESATGTGIGLVLGYKLAENNLVTGEYPSGDQKEAKRWEAEGIQPNSVKVNGTWVSMNYLGPFGSLLQQGRRFQESQAEGDSFVQSAGESQVGVARDALNQSYLQGINSSLEAVKDPQRALQSKVNGTAGTVIPSAINDVAVALDSKQRQVSSPKDAIQARIPGARNLLPVKQDVYGNELDRKTGAVSSVINPLRPSDDKSQKNSVVSEVSRLKNVDRTNKDLHVTPTPVGKTLEVEGQKIKLNDKQRYDLQKQVGQMTQKTWGELIKTDKYKALDDAGKAEALMAIRKDAAGAAQRQYVVDNNLAIYENKPTEAISRFIQGQVDVSKYAKAKSDDSGSDNESYADKYETAKSEFDTDSRDWTPVQKIKKQNELRQLEIKKDYDNDTVDTYGLNKQQVWDYLSTDPDGKAKAERLLAYGDALEAAGLGTNKFRNSKGSIAIRPAKKGSGGGRSKSLSTLLSEFKTPYTDMVEARTKGAKLVRSAKLASKRA